MEEDLFLKIEQCKHLQELGLDMSDARFCFFEYPITFDSNGNVLEKDVCIHGMKELKVVGVDGNFIPTYTLQEVMNHVVKLLKMNEFVSYDSTLDGAYELLCRMLTRKDNDSDYMPEPPYESALVFDDIDDDVINKEYTLIKKRKQLETK